jgi:probable rRNA maturation factor
MNRVHFNVEEVPPPSWKGRAKDYILKVLQFLKKDKWDLSVLFCGNTAIKNLNLHYRDRDEATDVLSFFLGETRRGRYLPGDIVISLETLEENAAYFKVEPDEELRRLLVHGILHLDGMDHETNEEGEPMLQLQEKVLVELAGKRIL